MYIPPQPIDKDQLKALKDADRYYAALTHDGANLRAIKKVVWQSQHSEVEIEIPVGCRVHDYGKPEYPDDGYMWTYTASVHLWNSAIVQSIAAILRPGDELTLSLIRANYSPVMEEYGVDVDSVELEVRRGKAQYRFNLTYEIVTPKTQSGWRMVRREMRRKDPA